MFLGHAHGFFGSRPVYPVVKMTVQEFRGLGYICQLSMMSGAPLPYWRVSREEGECPTFLADSLAEIHKQVAVAHAAGGAIHVVYLPAAS